MKFFGGLLLLALVLAGLVLFFLKTPFGPNHETFVDIPSGTGTIGIAQRLTDAGVIRSRLAFEIYRKFAGGTLRAGEYRFDHPQPLTQVYAKLAHGEVYTRTVAVPEGYNLFDIAQAVEAAGLGTAQQFLAATRQDASLIGDLSPHAASLEGFLFPDTYKFNRHATPDAMVAAMVRRFRAATVQLGIANSPDLARTVTLASLIEKEVSIDSERALVAGVFRNRIAAGMPLATDPTVIYAALLNGRWRGTIHQSDLQFDSPYNTYKHTGLPPGPIANPGLAALKAAIHPAPTDYLYFVADAQGHSLFSRDLKEHREQVQSYRRTQRAASPAADGH